MKGLVLPYRDKRPVLAPDVWIAPGACVIGDVEIGPGSSIWFNTVLRGDMNFIRIGERTNIQDGTVVHVTTETHPTRIGSDITVGHGVVLHGCTLMDRCLIGIRSVILDGAVVESGAIVAAGSVVTPGKRVPSGQMWSGTPARHQRDLTEAEMTSMITGSVQRYQALAAWYRDNLPERPAS